MAAKPKPAESGKRLKDQLFSDAKMVTRSADELQTHHYTTGEIVMRIWREHLRPRIGLLAACQPRHAAHRGDHRRHPLHHPQTADDVFVAKNQQMIYWVTAAIVVVTIVKAISEYVADVTVAYLGHRFIADLRIEMFAKLASADLSFIQTVHSGRLLSGFLNDANLLRQTASRSIVTLGENYLKVIILVATMFYMDARFAFHDPAVHAVCLVPARASAPQDAEIDHQVAAGDRRSLGADHPDLARHARGARLPAGAQGRSPRGAPPSIGRSNSPCAARAPARCPARRSSSSPDLALRLAIYFAGTKGVRGDLTLGQFMGFMTSALLIYGPLKSAATLADQFAGRGGGGEPRVQYRRPRDASWSKPPTPSRSS